MVPFRLAMEFRSLHLFLLMRYLFEEAPLGVLLLTVQKQKHDAQCLSDIYINANAFRLPLTVHIAQWE